MRIRAGIETGLKMRIHPISRGMIIAAASLAILAACGKDGSSTTPTQVAAKVNGDEITVHQVNQAMARIGRVPPEQVKAASKQVVDQLVDQQLLIQKAVEKKLDRDPDVMNALENSRRQILAQAYIEKSVLAATPKATPEEVKKFYDARPELFSQRRIYRIQELALKITPEQLPALRDQVAKTKNLNDLVAWLRSNNIPFNANSAVRAAEQLPLEALPRLSKMQDGEILALQNQGQTTILQLAASQSAPLTEKEATPQIEQFLLNQKKSELTSLEMKQLRTTAKLSYEGEFAKAAETTPAAAAKTESAPAQAQAGAVPQASAVPATTGTAATSSGSTAAAPSADAAGFEKGLKALR